MRSIKESIIGRKTSYLLPLDRVKNPSYSDLNPWNIVRTLDGNGITEYGIIVPWEVASEIFNPAYFSNYNSIVFYEPQLPDITQLATGVFRHRFPNSDINIQICDIWTGGKYYFENKLRTRKDFIKFLRPIYENPKEFEKKMLR